MRGDIPLNQRKNMLKLKLIPLKNGLLENASNNVDVLITISAEDEKKTAAPQRLPLDLSLVIDRSGSMQGHPLDQVKICVSKIIDQLSETDHLSVVSYDHQSAVVVQRQHVSNRELIAWKVSEIYSRGMTDIFSGWSTACKEFPLETSKESLRRIVLLSDGQANEGLTEINGIEKFVSEAAGRDITTSTYGTGHSFNEHLMTSMARAGNGKAYYGQTANDLINPFLEELDLLRAMLSRHVRLGIRPQIGLNYEIPNNYRTDQNNLHILPDISAGGAVWALIRLKIETLDSRQIKDGQAKLFEADLLANELDSEREVKVTVPFYLPVLDQRAYAELRENEKVSLRKFELLAAEEQIRAYNSALHDDWNAVNSSLEKLDELGRSNTWIAASANRLRRYANKRQKGAFSKEAHFKSAAFSRRMAPLNENPTFSSLDEDKSLPSYLRRRSEEGKR
jgi:Ca-activated chloride channel homolog